MDGAIDYVSHLGLAPVGSVASFSDTVYIGVRFTSVGGKARNRIAKLSADGTVQDGGRPAVGGDRLAFDGDERISIGGTSLRSALLAYPLYIGDTIFATHFD